MYRTRNMRYSKAYSMNTPGLLVNLHLTQRILYGTEWENY